MNHLNGPSRPANWGQQLVLFVSCCLISILSLSFVSKIYKDIYVLLQHHGN